LEEQKKASSHLRAATWRFNLEALCPKKKVAVSSSVGSDCIVYLEVHVIINSNAMMGTTPSSSLPFKFTPPFTICQVDAWLFAF
jgi:hypothetical protein